MCCNEELAKDILQDTMLKAITNFDKFQGNCSLKTWLCTIARNLYYDYLKKSETQNLSFDDLPEQAEQNSFVQQITDSDSALRIHHLLHRLDEPYREVFTLRVFAELKFSDIASIFQKSESWAGVTFYRAKRKLIQLMKEEGLYDEE